MWIPTQASDSELKNGWEIVERNHTLCCLQIWGDKPPTRAKVEDAHAEAKHKIETALGQLKRDEEFCISMMKQLEKDCQ